MVRESKGIPPGGPDNEPEQRRKNTDTLTLDTLTLCQFITLDSVNGGVCLDEGTRAGEVKTKT